LNNNSLNDFNQNWTGATFLDDRGLDVPKEDQVVDKEGDDIARAFKPENIRRPQQ